MEYLILWRVWYDLSKKEKKPNKPSGNNVGLVDVLTLNLPSLLNAAKGVPMRTTGSMDTRILVVLKMCCSIASTNLT